MKYISLILTAIVAMAFTACKSSDYDPDKVAEYVAKYNEQSEDAFSPEEAEEVAVLVIGYYNDKADFNKMIAGETDPDTRASKEGVFKNEHVNGNKIVNVYNEVKGILPQETRMRVEKAKVLAGN